MKTKKILIDTDTQPAPYAGLEIIEHKGMGTIEWNPGNFELYLDKKQENGYIEGNALRKELEGKQVVNATLMDYLYEHDLFPESWKKNKDGDINYIYAWGTIYRLSGGYLYVRYWYWSDGAWQRYCNWLDRGWGVRCPALVLASSQALESNHLDTLPLAALEERVDRVEQVMREVAAQIGEAVKKLGEV